MKETLGANKVALVRLVLFLVALTVLSYIGYHQYELERRVGDLNLKVNEVNKKLMITPSVTPTPVVTPTSYLKPLKIAPTK